MISYFLVFLYISMFLFVLPFLLWVWYCFVCGIFDEIKEKCYEHRISKSRKKQRLAHIERVIKDVIQREVK